MRFKPKLFLVFGFLLFVPVWLIAQTITGGGLAISCNAVTTTGVCTAFALAAPQGNLPAAFTWQTITTGSPTGVSITLEGSIDGSTFTTLDTSTSTGGELRSVTGKPIRILRCNLGTFSGGTAPSMTCQFTVTSSGTGGGGGGGGGTVTNTGGALTNNAVVLGAGGNDTKVSTGITTNGASGLSLGSTGVGGTFTLFGGTSGSQTFTAPGNGTELDLSATALKFATSNGSITTAGGSFNLNLSAGQHVVLSPIGNVQVAGTSTLGFVGGKGQHFINQAATSDVAGTVSGTTTTATLTFTTNYTATPSCTVTPTTAGVTSFYLSAQAVSGFTITYAPSGSTSFNYHCIGNPN